MEILIVIAVIAGFAALVYFNTRGGNTGGSSGGAPRDSGDKNQH